LGQAPLPEHDGRCDTDGNAPHLSWRLAIGHRPHKEDALDPEALPLEFPVTVRGAAPMPGPASAPKILAKTVKRAHRLQSAFRGPWAAGASFHLPRFC